MLRPTGEVDDRQDQLNLEHRETPVEFRDGYAAREVLQHDGCVRVLADDQMHILAELVEACALDRRELPEEAEAELPAALNISERVIRRPNCPIQK